MHLANLRATKLTLLSPYFLGFLQLINLRRENKVRFRQPVHRVRPGSDLNLAPSEQNIGMMPLLLGNLSNTVHKGECGTKIWELVGAYQMVLAHDIPMRRLCQLAMNLGEVLPLERRNAAPARNAGLIGE